MTNRRTIEYLTRTLKELSYINEDSSSLEIWNILWRCRRLLDVAYDLIYDRDNADPSNAVNSICHTMTNIIDEKCAKEIKPSSSEINDIIDRIKRVVKTIDQNCSFSSASDYVAEAIDRVIFIKKQTPVSEVENALIASKKYIESALTIAQSKVDSASPNIAVKIKQSIEYCNSLIDYTEGLIKKCNIGDKPKTEELKEVRDRLSWLIRLTEKSDI